MTRKKSSTPAMGSKRKNEGKGKGDKAEMAATAEAKASEVIPAVPVALLEAHPQLPDRELILMTFAEHYPAALRAAEELAKKAAEPPPEPEPAAKKRRVALQPPTLPPVARPEDRGPTAFAAPPARVEVAPEPEPEPEPVTSTLSFDEELPPASTPDEEADDFFARLQAEGEAAVGGRSSMFDDVEDVPHSATEPSNPFIPLPTLTQPEAEPAPEEGATTMMAAFVEDEQAAAPEEGATTMMAAFVEDEPVSDGATTMMAAFVDDEPAPTAAPTDATAMIQAMPDDEPEASGEGPAEEQKAAGGRKSRKANKKKR